jgi:hypothetical protein
MHNGAMENDLENIEITSGCFFRCMFYTYKNLPNTSEIIPIGMTSMATRQSAIANDIRK